ncbi:MAG: amidohydrolase [Reyranella sp.]|nr:amidohydrolase [Reyranella sp.]
MLDGNVFVFDNVVHMYDLSDDNLKRPDSALDRHWHLKIGVTRRPHGQDKAYGITDGYAAFAKRWNAADLGKMLFQESSTDMAMAQAVPLFDVYKDGFAPVRAQYEFHKAFPERTLFCGAVDPGYPSVAAACEEMERQVKEWGAVTFKFYNSHLEGKTWRCDDPEVAYPMYEKARSLGLKVLQFHKGFPISRARLDGLAPLDLHQAAMDFPDITFAVHHLALPYFEEMVYLAAVFPNVHLVLSGTMHLPVIAPWEFKMYMGRLLRDIGSERILWGSEAPLLGNPQPMIEWFWNMQIDEELQDRYGFPEITDADKRRILGENQAKMFNIDVAQALQRIGRER